MEAVDLNEIAEAVGTPAYVYNAEAIRRRHAELTAAFASVPHRIHYAVKANGNLAVLSLMRRLGTGADIVSGGELARCVRAGFAPADIVFSGVGKTGAELAEAAGLGLDSINVESVEELADLGRVAAALGRNVRVGIRFNPDVTAGTHPYISTGQSGIKFGVPCDQVADAVRVLRAHPALELRTVAIHIGSQITSVEPYRRGAGRLVELWTALREAGVSSITTLDIGGGLGIRYLDEEPPTPAQLAGAVVPSLRPTGLRLHLEPGRYLIGSAGVLVTRVLYRKLAGGKVFLVTDAGMNDLVRPSRYGAYHHIVELVRRRGPEQVADVVGPVCETGDFLALDRSLPPIQAGDHVAVLGGGAYGFVMASSYNARPRPPEVMVEGGGFRVIRRRETVEELMTGETE
jgi:diaminopimelate decarboxylase